MAHDAEVRADLRGVARDLVHRVADVSRLRSALGWVPATPLEDGLRETIAWLRAEGLPARGPR